MLEAFHTIVLGRTGSGKTLFVRRLLWNAIGVRCRFVFDWNDRFTWDWRGNKLPFVVCYTEADLENALPSRWVIYNPAVMFPGAIIDKKIGMEALRWFAGWVRLASKRGKGRKQFAIAELWRFCTEDSIPTELALIAQDGRGDGVEFVFDTQRPDKLNGSVIGAATELVCFRLDESEARKAVGKMREGAGDTVKQLPLGSFVSYNLLGDDITPGRIF